MEQKEPIDFFAEFAVDKEKAEHGAPLTISGTTFMVAKANNPKLQAERNRLMLELFDKFDAEERNEGNAAWVTATVEAMRKASAKALILGWDKLKFKGEVYEGYNEDVAYQLLNLDDFADIILNFAANRRNYSLLTEDAAKN